MALVVETIVADTMAELRSRRDRSMDADLVELRLDGVRDVDAAGALDGCRLPAIVTCRPPWEGGRFDGSEEERLAILKQAARSGARYVDLEWNLDRDVIAACRRHTQVVLSHHDFTGTPSDLNDRVRTMRQKDAHVVKIAVTAASTADCVTLRDAFAGDHAHVALAMGAPGQFTRLWPAWTGSLWTYGGTAAPGQVSARELSSRYRVRATSLSTAVYGVTGCPLGHSASPAMHNAAFAALGIDAVYLPLPAAGANEFLALADALRLGGASVTIPLKHALLTSAVKVDDLPQKIGALNTLRRAADGWEGRNFDVAGFLEPIDRRRIALGGKRAVVLGAGGAARAVVWALISRGAKVEIAARRPEAARELASCFGARAAGWPPAAGWDLLVNTTPVGMWPQVDDAPVDGAALASSSGNVVYDLVYNPIETKLLRDANAAGAVVIDGLEMLVSQACRQFEWWTGREAPRGPMAEAAREFVMGRGA